jgi:hypothetical protein
MSRARLDTVENGDYAPSARASSGVFARTEQHVGQLFEGVQSRGVGATPTVPAEGHDGAPRRLRRATIHGRSRCADQRSAAEERKAEGWHAPDGR